MKKNSLDYNRLEDWRLLTGNGRFLDDIEHPGTCYISFVRSPYPHAEIIDIDFSSINLPGIIDIITYRDLDDHLIGPSTICRVEGMQDPGQPLLAKDIVRYIGEPIVMIIARSKRLARACQHQIKIKYKKLDAVIGLEAVMRGQSKTLVHDGIQGNLAFEWNAVYGNTDLGLQELQKANYQFVIPRVAPLPMETRGLFVDYDYVNDQIYLETSTQIPHAVRAAIAYSISHPEQRIIVKSPDVGGAFGAKMNVYREEILAAYFSKKMRIPLKYIETRSENFVGTTHGRDQVQDVTVYFGKNGRVYGLDVVLHANMGAYLQAGTPAIPLFTAQMLSGCYNLEYLKVKVMAYYTNQTPTDAYRGAGRPEAIYLIERVIELVAKRCGLDSIEVRKLNFIRQDEFPKKVITNLVYDSGNYERTLDLALSLSNYKKWREEQEKRRNKQDPVQLGIGISSYVEFSGSAPSKNNAFIGLQSGGFESAVVRFHPTGSVTVISGSSPTGQGHQTSWTQIVERTLGIPRDHIDIVTGNTQNTPWGGGSFGSRSASVGGTAIYKACLSVIDKGKKFLSSLWDVPIEEIDFSKGMYICGQRKEWLGKVAQKLYLAHDLPDDMEPGLEATIFYEPENFTYPFGTHICIVEVDTRTGEPSIVQYYAIDDCGKMINEQIAKGQIIGGILQGVGQALYEEVAHDRSSKLITHSFRTYHLPKATHVFPINLKHTVTPSPVNPLGVKGVGESGTIGSIVAVSNAILDALTPFEIDHLHMPHTPEKIWNVIRRQTHE